MAATNHRRFQSDFHNSDALKALLTMRDLVALPQAIFLPELRVKTDWQQMMGSIDCAHTKKRGGVLKTSLSNEQE